MMTVERATTDKSKRPETMRQAQTWDMNAKRYRTAGFCDRCAAQAAWGHQLGFSTVRPVCDACRGHELPSVGGERALRWVNREPESVER